MPERETSRVRAGGPPTGIAMSRPSIRTLSMALIVIAVVALAAHFFGYLRYAIATIFYPFEAFDAEGIVWQQAMLIPGPRMYGDIDSYPFIVFHYPPLFHLAVRGLSLLGVSPLLAGRAISVAATLATAATIAMLTWRLVGADAGRFARLASSLVSGLAFFCFYAVVATSPLMRVDMLAVALSFMGLFLFATSSIQSRRLFAGMACFVLAVYTKQTSIAAPVAAIVVLGMVAPRRAFALAGVGLVLGLVPLCLLTWMTNGGFLRHLVLYNINRYDLGQVWRQLAGEAIHLGFAVMALTAIVIWWRRFSTGVRGAGMAAWRDSLAADAGKRAMVMITLHLGITTAMLAGLGKSGATLAYFNEWMGNLAILTGVLVAMLVAPVDAKGAFAGVRFPSSFRLLLPFMLIVQVLVSPAKREFGVPDAAQARELDTLVGRIARADKTVLSDDMVMLMLAGKEVPWEPAIFAELAAVGLWDETRLTRMIAAREFAFVMTREATNFSDNVLAAVTAAYPKTEKTAGYIIHHAPQ